MALKQSEKENKDNEKMAQRSGSHQSGLGQFENEMQDYQFPDMSNVGEKKGKEKVIIILGVVVLLIISFFAVPRFLNGSRTVDLQFNNLFLK